MNNVNQRDDPRDVQRDDEGDDQREETLPPSGGEDHGDGAALKNWLAGPIEASARQAIERVRRAQDVVHVAVMPDVHVAGDACVGVAMATTRLLYPAAVGGDIGCGMLAMAFNASADVFNNAARAGAVLREIGRRVPTSRRNRARLVPLPLALRAEDLSDRILRSVGHDDGTTQFGTLGSGNHFIELQADEDDRLWLMVHSGSRAIGQAVKDVHLSRSTIRSAGLCALDADSAEGQAYLHDQDWARRYAEANRAAMADQVAAILREAIGIEPLESPTITCDHNHVRRETHFGRMLFIHRKGAMPADSGLAGVAPGSMGAASFHVEGRGCADALRSSAHGAGRALSRHAARQRFTRMDVQRQMQGIWFDPRLAESLREESPGAYKDVQAVMRAQRELVKTTRKLRPILVYKGR